MEETKTKDTKICPFCGKEILSTAKKCKHCGHWLEKQCPCCGEWINVKAKKCRYCGTWLNKYTREKYEGTPVTTAPLKIKQDLREAVEDEEDRRDANCLMDIECVTIVLICGFVYDWSVWTYVLALAISEVLLHIRVLRILYCIGISFVWGAIGYCLSPWIFGDSDWDMLVRLATEDFSDYWWVGAIFFALSILFHWPAMKARFN